MVDHEGRKFRHRINIFFSIFFGMMTLGALLGLFFSRFNIMGILIFGTLMFIVIIGVIALVISNIIIKSRGESSGVSYSTQLSGEETKYLLFGKKICPRCGSKMVKDKRIRDMGRGYFSLGIHHMGEPTPRTYGDIKEVDIYFKCKSCNSEFPLKDLAGDRHQ